jgi:H+/Cl- antiporter ClcA
LSSRRLPSQAISFFDAETITRAYFICIAAYYMAIIMGQRDSFLDSDSFTEYQLNTQCNAKYNIVDIFYFVMLGVFGGLLGALFNAISSRLHRWRRVGDVTTCTVPLVAPCCSNIRIRV